MAALGLIGLGPMGRGIGKSLMRAQANKHIFSKMLVYDCLEKRVEKFMENIPESNLGFVKGARSLSEIGHSCDVIVLSVPEAAVCEIVREIAIKKSPSHRRALLIDTSTTSVDIARESAFFCERNGCTFIDSPVSGLPERADQGTLVAMVGGPTLNAGSFPSNLAFETIQSFCQENGVVHVGTEIGSGQICKALNNVLYNISIAAMAEQLPLAVKLGLDPEKVIQVVANSSGASFGFNKWSIECINRNFKGGYPMGEAVKDWHLLEKISEEKIKNPEIENKQSLGPVAHAAKNVYFQTLKEIDNAQLLHKGAMIKLHEKRLGVVVSKNESSNSTTK